MSANPYLKMCNFFQRFDCSSIKRVLELGSDRLRQVGFYLLLLCLKLKLSVFDITGREIESLENSYKAPGVHSVNWNASNYPSGVYLIHLVSGDIIRDEKVVLMK